MVNVGKLIVDNIINTIESLKEKLMSKKSERVSSIISRINNSLDVLRNLKPPLVLTKRYVDATNFLIRYVVKLKNLIEEYINDKVLEEDLFKVLQEYENAIRVYSIITVRERFKTQLYLAIPQLILISTLAYQIYIANIPLHTPLLEIVIVLVMSSIVLLNYNVVFSHAINVISALILLNNMINIGIKGNILALIVPTLYIVALLSSLSFMHLSYVISSKKHLSRIESILKGMLSAKYTVVHKDKERKALDKNIKMIEKTVREIYRSLYGDKAEDYLRYKLTLLIISKGISKEEALKRLLEEVEEFKPSRSKVKEIGGEQHV